jgi:hypothetical protein
MPQAGRPVDHQVLARVFVAHSHNINVCGCLNIDIGSGPASSVRRLSARSASATSFFCQRLAVTVQRALRDEVALHLVPDEVSQVLLRDVGPDPKRRREIDQVQPVGDHQHGVDGDLHTDIIEEAGAATANSSTRTSGYAASSPTPSASSVTAVHPSDNTTRRDVSTLRGRLVGHPRGSRDANSGLDGHAAFAGRGSQCLVEGCKACLVMDCDMKDAAVR